jgi:peroxiredoxin
VIVRRRLPAALLALAVPLWLSLLAACPSPSSTGGPGAKSGASASGDDVKAGAQATDFTLRDSEGRNVSLSDYLGKQVILIDFWATWCVPCQAAIPHLKQLYESRKDKGFVVLGIAMDGPETIAQVPTFVQRYQMSFPVLLDEETKVVNVYNPKRTAPLSLLIDKSGKIVKIRSGYNAGDEKLIESEVDALLQ